MVIASKPSLVGGPLERGVAWHNVETQQLLRHNDILMMRYPERIIGGLEEMPGLVWNCDTIAYELGRDDSVNLSTKCLALKGKAIRADVVRGSYRWLRVLQLFPGRLLHWRAPMTPTQSALPTNGEGLDL